MHFGGKRKSGKGRPPKYGVWVFGALEVATSQVVVVHVKDREAQTLLDIIQQWVLPGSTVMSDSWSSYERIGEAGYVAQDLSIFNYCFSLNFT